MKILQILIFVALCGSILSSVNVNTLEKDTDLFQNALDQYHHTIRAEMESEMSEQEHPDFIKMLEATKFQCTNGKDPSSLSNKEYLTEFAKGPCNPAVILPGIGGSKLRVLIDCPTFKAKDPSAFAACGWKRCSGLQSPSSEYKAWIPKPFAPMSITLDSENARNCFNAMMGFDTSELSKGIIKPTPGV
jgi:hypothetical protein